MILRAAPEPAVPVDRRAGRAAAGAALVALALAAYFVPLLRAGWIWDDDYYVVENMTLRSLHGLRAIWLQIGAVPQYYPMVHTSFWLEYHVFGSSPLGYHLDNLALHATTVVLVWLALSRLAVPGSWLAAAVFAVHPVHVETVAWVTERKNVLSAMFYVAACLCFMRFLRLDAEKDEASTDRAGPVGSYLLGAGSFVAALLSKTVAGSLPAAMLLLVWWKRGRIRLREAAAMVPLLALSGVMGFVTSWLEKHNVGAEGEAWNLSFHERCLIAGRALWFYFGKIVWPHRLMFVYPRWRLDAGSLSQNLWIAAAVLALAALWALRKRLGTGPLVGMLFFAGTLAPALGFFNVFPMRFSFVADHFQYLASLGVIAVLSAAIVGALRRTGVAWLPAAVVAPMLGLLVLLTSRQAGAYRSAETLWRDTLEKNPSAGLAHANLGVILAEQGRMDDAMEQFREATRLEPTIVEPRLNLAELLEKNDRWDDAVGALEDAVRVEPDHIQARYLLGTALAHQGRYEDAVVHLTEAIRLRPDFASAEYNLGTALLRMDRPREAALHLTAAVHLRPDHAASHVNLARALDRLGRPDEASVERAEGERLRSNPH